LFFKIALKIQNYHSKKILSEVIKNSGSNQEVLMGSEEIFNNF